MTTDLQEHPKIEHPAFDAKVYVVDDDKNFRKSLTWLIESVGIKAEGFGSAQEFLDGLDPDAAGCVVLDVRMPGMSGLDLLEQLREKNTDIPVIVMTAYADVPMAVRAMKTGAIDFLQKPFSDQVLLDRIQRTLSDNSEKRDLRARNKEIDTRFSQLTKRERQVMQLVVDGSSSKQIAEELGVSFKTVESHRAKIMKKMEARSVPHLIHMSLRRES